jgi:hypothetical protein
MVICSLHFAVNYYICFSLIKYDQWSKLSNVISFLESSLVMELIQSGAYIKAALRNSTNLTWCQQFSKIASRMSDIKLGKAFPWTLLPMDTRVSQ